MTGLIAVNVMLGSTDVSIAERIATMVRGPSGGFPSIRSIGLSLTERGVVAVSMNMFDTVNTPIYRAFNLIQSEAARYGVPVVGTQIIGTLPQEALIGCAEYYLRLEGFDRAQIIENHLIDLLAPDLSATHVAGSWGRAEADTESPPANGAPALTEGWSKGGGL